MAAGRRAAAARRGSGVTARVWALAGIALVATVATGCGATHRAGVTCATELARIAPVTNKGARRATGSAIVVDGANAGFAPTCVSGVPRGVVSLTVRNTGLVIHNVEIAAQHFNVDIAPGRSATVRVRVGAAPVVFVCRYHRSLGMVGVLIPSS